MERHFQGFTVSGKLEREAVIEVVGRWSARSGDRHWQFRNGEVFLLLKLLISLVMKTRGIRCRHLHVHCAKLLRLFPLDSAVYAFAKKFLCRDQGDRQWLLG